MNAHFDSKRSAEMALLLLLGFLWGVPYALTKLTLPTIAPLTNVAIRVTMAAAALWLYALLRQRREPIRRGIFGPVFIQGMIGCAIPYGLIAIGQQSVDSALTSILNSTTPVFVCAIGFICVRSERLGGARLFGIATGLAGVAIVVGGDAFAGFDKGLTGQAAILAATFSSAWSVIYGRRFAWDPPEIVAAGTLTSASLVLIPLCFLVETPLATRPSGLAVAALCANSLLATALGFVIYFRLISSIGSIGTASVGYLKPAVGLLIGGALLGETLHWSAAFGLLTIVAGVTAINWRPTGSATWTSHWPIWLFRRHTAGRTKVMAS